jgi:hypothetical protein
MGDLCHWQLWQAKRQRHSRFTLDQLLDIDRYSLCLFHVIAHRALSAVPVPSQGEMPTLGPAGKSEGVKVAVRSFARISVAGARHGQAGDWRVDRGGRCGCAGLRSGLVCAARRAALRSHGKLTNAARIHLSGCGSGLFSAGGRVRH